jgi:uncharacterized OsmC-like protein
MGVSKETRAGFQRVRLFLGIDTKAPEEELANLIKLTERYCVVFETLQQPPEMKLSIGTR